MKKKLLILMCMAIALLFAVCNGETSDPVCECNPKEHNEGDQCCGGKGCGCNIILKCVCSAGTLHLVGEKCRGSLNCECELNVVGVRASNGVAITNRDNAVSKADFDELVGYVNTALAHAQLSSEARQNFIKNNLKEIGIVPDSGGDAPVIVNGILIIEVGKGQVDIRLAIRTWCEAENIAMMFKQFDNSKDKVRFALT